jgi:hypothetical protein
MKRLLALPALAAILSAAVAPSASAKPPSARLQGSFAMSGHVTTAVHVKGEYAGEPVSRTWTFAPLCAAGPCARISLTRSRAGGADTLTLKLQPSGRYEGTERFYVPVGCAGHVHPHGEAAPFTISVVITATQTTSAGTVATGIKATYTNRKRVNLTRCVALPSHDAAVYAGTLSPTAGRLNSRSPAGS